MKFPKRLPLTLNIQFFAEQDPPTDPPQDPPADPPNDPPADPPQDPPAKTFTEEEVEKLIKERVAREQKAKEKAIEEAAKLAKMNADEKREYEFQKLQDELAELKKKDAFYGLSKEATKMLAGADIAADDEVLSFVVKDTAEDTQTAVNSFVGLVSKKVEEGVKKALAGTSPKTTVSSGAVTRESIMAIKDSSQRIKTIQENPQLFKH